MNASISLRRLASFFGLSSELDSRDLDAQVGRHLLQVERLEHLADRFRADLGGEAVVAVLVLRLEILVLGQQLTVLQRGQARLQHDVIFEIQNALEILQRHVEQQADAARQRLQEPDVRDRRGELDMAHALAPHARQRHFDRALLADDALVLHALVLAAQALVVLDRPEDARAEQAVALRLEGAVVDGFRLLDLAVGPGQNLLRARDRNPDLVEDLRRNLRAEKIHDFLIHRLLLDSGWACPSRKPSGRQTVPTGTAPSPSRNSFANYSAASAARPPPLTLLRIVQVDVEAERTHLLDQHVEAFRNAGFERVVAAHDRLVDLGAAGDVVRLHRQHFLQRVGCAVSFERPHLHFAEPLAAELRLAAQRLLGDERVRTDRTRVDLVVDQMMQLEHVDVAHRHLAIELLAGAAVDAAMT